MFARWKGSACQVLAPGKLNLTLRILGRRDDGFHELETMMAPVSIYDRLSYRPARGPGAKFRFSSSAIAGAATPPSGGENLAHRALVRLAEFAGIEPRGDFRLQKRIPAAAGLGGGSSDAAAALRLGNAAWDLRLPDRSLATLAAELGSDVPFFLAGGTALCRGRGERVDRLQYAPVLPVVVVKPPEGVSTPAAFAQLGLPSGDVKPTTALSPAATSAIAALQSVHWPALRAVVVNGLQGVAEKLCVAIARIRRAFERLDVVAHCMTGSGSASFAICRSMRHAQRIAAQVRAQNLGMVFATATCR